MRPILIPEYFSEFQCIGGDCEDTCCAGWNIIVDKKTYQAYRKVRNSELVEKLKHNVKRNRKSSNDSDYAQIILNENRKCSMLLEDGLCGIHKELGEKYLCNTCAVYPRHITQVGQVVEKSLTLSCPEAARVALLREEGIGFVETEEPENARGFLNGLIDLEKNPYFWELRIFIIKLMQNRQQSVEIRLIILGLFLQKIEQLNQNELEESLYDIMDDYLSRLENESFIGSLENLQKNLNFQISLIREIIRARVNSKVTSPKYVDIITDVLEGLELEDKEIEENIDIEQTKAKYEEAYLQYYEPFFKNKEYILENYIVNYIFKNLFPYDYKTYFESYMMLVTHFTLIKLHIIGVAAKRKEVTEGGVLECIQQLAKVIEHDPLFLQGVRDEMERLELNTMGHMFVMIQS